MKKQNRYFIDLAHMHPVCPLSLSHARVFTLIDVWARWQKSKEIYSFAFPGVLSISVFMLE